MLDTNKSYVVQLYRIIRILEKAPKQGNDTNKPELNIDLAKDIGNRLCAIGSDIKKEYCDVANDTKPMNEHLKDFIKKNAVVEDEVIEKYCKPKKNKSKVYGINPPAPECDSMKPEPTPPPPPIKDGEL